MPDKVTSKELLAALRAKFYNDAVLSEVTMTDEEEAHRHRSAQVILIPQYKEYYDKRGESYDVNLVIPDGYMLGKVITSRRIDALIFETKQRTAVEIKISRADFFRDTDEKRSAWMKHTHRFVYLTPKGLVKVEEVPEGCGLWEYENGKITIVKRSKTNKGVEEFPTSMVKYFAWRAFAAERKLANRR